MYTKIMNIPIARHNLIYNDSLPQCYGRGLYFMAAVTVPPLILSALYYRALQRVLLKSLRSGRRESKKVSLSTKHVRNYLLWWALNSGFRGNSVTSWSPRKSDVSVWSDASPWGEGAVNSHGDYFQRSWTET